MHDEILQKHSSARLNVMAVWFNMLPADSRQGLDTRVLSDPRVTYYWDQDKLTGRYFSDHVKRRAGITWDAYFLFGPDARWAQSPAPLVSSGSPVIASTNQLLATIRPFLAG